MNLTIPNAGKDVLELSYGTVQRNGKMVLWLLIKLKYTHQMTQQVHTWVFIWEKRKLKFAQKPVHKCLQKGYSQLPILATIQLHCNW